MSLIRLQKRTPDVYTNESRDFQLLLRLYDCVINGMEYDISSILNILDTRLCQSNLIPLLQTKLGFFTKGQYNDEDIRYILSGFKTIVRNKGSLKAIRYLLGLYLKIKKITSPLSAYYLDYDKQLENGFTIPAHSIVIEIQSSFTDIDLLKEVFRYILPVGVGYYIYFYETIKDYDKLMYDDNATLLFTSINLNSRLRGSNQIFNDYNDNSGLLFENSNFLDQMDNRIIGAINSTVLAPINSNQEPEIVSSFSNLDKAYKINDVDYTNTSNDLFLGIYENSIQDPTLSDFIEMVGSGIENNQCLLYRDRDSLTSQSFSEYIFYQQQPREYQLLPNFLNINGLNYSQSTGGTYENGIYTVTQLVENDLQDDWWASNRIAFDCFNNIDEGDLLFFKLEIENLNNYTYDDISVGILRYLNTTEVSGYRIVESAEITNMNLQKNQHNIFFKPVAASWSDVSLSEEDVTPCLLCVFFRLNSTDNSIEDQFKILDFECFNLTKLSSDPSTSQDLKDAIQDYLESETSEQRSENESKLIEQFTNDYSNEGSVQKLNWKGNYSSLPANEDSNSGDVVYQTSDNTYYVYDGNNWTSGTYPLYLFEKEVIPQYGQ